MPKLEVRNIPKREIVKSLPASLNNASMASLLVSAKLPFPGPRDILTSKVNLRRQCVFRTSFHAKLTKKFKLRWVSENSKLLSWIHEKFQLRQNCWVNELNEKKNAEVIWQIFHSTQILTFFCRKLHFPPPADCYQWNRQQSTGEGWWNLKKLLWKCQL